MKKTRSNAYAYLSLAIAILSILWTFSGIKRGHVNVYGIIQTTSPIGFFLNPIVPIILGIIGLESPAKKLAIVGIIIAVMDFLLISSVYLLLPILIGIYGPG